MDVPYKIYKQLEIEAEVQMSNDDEKAIFFSQGIYKCMLVINPCWSDTREINNSIVAHLAFYALSDGWGKYTSTGYHSIFFHHSDINQYKDANFIIQAFKTMLEEDSFVFEENIQIALF